MRETKISEQYQVGEVLLADIYTADGRLLLPKGTGLSANVYQQIIRWEEIGILAGPKSRCDSGDLEAQYASLKRVREGPEQTLFAQAIDTVRDVFSALRQGRGFEEDAIWETVTGLVSAVSQNEKTGFQLTRVGKEEDILWHHSVDVCLLSTMLGLYLGLNPERLEDLAFGAVLHDLGKVYIPDVIINKEGTLTREEFTVVKQHPVIGLQVLRKAGVRLTDGQTACIGQHHEKCNGTGYPSGIKYVDIHLFARIVAVADVYSALTTRRAYRERLNLYRATDILRNEFKGILDKHIVFVLMDRLHDLLLNNRVCLSSGEVGCVVRFFEDAPLHPLVLVTNDKDGRMLVSPYLLNLRETAGVFVERVLGENG